MKTVWILARQEAGKIDPVSFELIARARQFGGEVRALLPTPALPETVLRELIHRGADAVVALESPRFADFQPDVWAEALDDFLRANPVEILIAAADSTGRTLMPYLAMKVRTGLTADCTELSIDPASGLLLQTRPAIGGDIMASIQCPVRRPQMATVRPRSFPASPPDAARSGELLRVPARFISAQGRTELLDFIPDTDEFSLAEADRVVVVGRGIKKPENLAPVARFAAAIGAALGATREVVDRNWLPYRHQIGLSGRTVAPRLYIGLGVSGAIQHLAGMRTAATVVAVNKDPDAPIFKAADFGIVGDLFDVLPELSRRFGKEKQK